MTVLTISELIDLAIGSPEPGHVNFAALQCLLYSFAEKMKIINDRIDICSFSKALTKLRENVSRTSSKTHNIHKKRSSAVFVSQKSSATPSMSSRSSSNLSREKIPPTPATPKALEAILERRFREQPKRRLAAGADEPPAEETTEAAAEDTARAGEPAAEAPAEEAAEPPAETPTEAEAPEQPPAEAEAPPAEEAPVPVPEMAPPPPAESVAATAVTSKPDDEIHAEEEIEVDGTSPAPERAEGWVRMSRLGLTMNSLPGDLRTGIAVMKDQLELAMEELNILTTLMINNKTDTKRLALLRTLASNLRSIQHDNIYIEGRRPEKSTELMEGELEAEEMYEEELAEEEVEHAREEGTMSVKSGTGSVAHGAEQESFDLGLHVCYSPDRILEQLMVIKSEMCDLTNKINEIAAQLLKHDSNKMMQSLGELYEQIREVKHFGSIAREFFERIESDRQTYTRNFEDLRNEIAALQEKKIDRDETEVLLAEKVDYQQFPRKVSQEQLQQLQCRMERQFCEVNKLICITERGLKSIIDDIRATLGFHAIEGLLQKFKQGIDADICAVAQRLQKYVDATNDDCAAAGGRVKVLHDISCISCDTDCVMRTKDKSKVAKLKSAHQTNTIAPLVTYELSSIRKSGVMGYYRKDEFPSSPNAWLSRQKTMENVRACVPRHAGGVHTTYTARERVEKINMQKKHV